MLFFFNIAGGVALILFGVRFLRKGLDRLLGNRLGPLMRRLASSRIKAFFAGMGVAVVAPSSTTMSVLAVQTVRDGHLPPRRVLSVMLGADVGLTVMVLLIALRLDQFAIVFIFLGVIAFQFTRWKLTRGVGQIILSLGFIFLGIATISDAARAVQPTGDLVDLLAIASHYPVLLAALAAVLAVCLQSSTATIALAIGLSSAQLVNVNTLELAIPVVIGANVGVAITLLGVGWSQLDSRRLAAGNMLFKVITAAICLTFLSPLLAWMQTLPLRPDQHIAMAHSGFNATMALLFLPLITPVFRFTQTLIPDRPTLTPPPFAPLYLNNNHVEGFALATGQSRHEILRVSAIVRTMLDDLWQALLARDVALAQSVQARDDQVDLLDTAIKQYLARISSEDGDEDGASEVMGQLCYVNELETIGDIIDKNLAELVVKRAQYDLWFSDDGWEELDGFYKKVAENLLIAESAFMSRDRTLAERLIRHKQALSEEGRRLRDAHFSRLRAGQTQTHESSAVHLDILTHLRRINSCVTHVAYAIMQT